MQRLKLVPWEPTWLQHSSLDLHAIYRRPVRNPQTWARERDENGFVLWDICGPMSIRNHVKLLEKGFEYVTLARQEDVIQAADPSIVDRGATPLGGSGRPAGEGADWYLRQSNIGGPWHVMAYLADQADANSERLARVEENIKKYGPDGAEAFERQTDPGYQLPARYRQPVADAAPNEPPKRKRGRPRKTQPQDEPVTA